MAKLLGIEVNYIYIYPLGGITKLNTDLNINLYKELVVLIAGPLSQFNALFLLKSLFPSEIEMINYYHYSILLFNLLPIYPLDGGKIMNLIIEMFIPYKLSIKVSVFSSYIILLGLFFYNEIKINIIVMIILLLVLIFKEHKKIDYLHNKFILERYLNNYKFKDTKIVLDKNSFYRNKKHLIKDKYKYYFEKEYLAKILKKY